MISENQEARVSKLTLRPNRDRAQSLNALMKVKSKFAHMKFSKIQLVNLMTSFCLFFLFSCTNADKDSWKDELKATPEYSEIARLRSAMVAEDPLIAVNSKIDNYLKGKSQTEKDDFFKVWDDELIKMQSFDFSKVKLDGLHSKSEMMKKTSDLFVAEVTKSLLPEILKEAMIKSSIQATEKQIKVYALEEVLKKRFPQLEHEPLMILKMQRENSNANN